MPAHLMHEPDETPEDHTAAETPTEPVEAAGKPVETTDEPDDDTDPDESTKGGREAAKYRRRLREAEAERDALAGQVDTLRRGAVERIAAEQMPAPELLWAAGTELADLLDDEGGIDPEKVVDAAADVSARYGVRRSPRPHPAQREAPPEPRRTGTEAMVDALKPKARH